MSITEDKKAQVIAEEHGDEIHPDMEATEMFKTFAAYTGHVDVIEKAIKLVQATWVAEDDLVLNPEEESEDPAIEGWDDEEKENLAKPSKRLFPVRSKKN